MQLALGKGGKGLALHWQRKGVVMGVEFAHLCCALLCAAVHCCVASGHTEGHLAETNEESGAVARRDLRCHIAGLCAVRRGGRPGRGACQVENALGSMPHPSATWLRSY